MDRKKMITTAPATAIATAANKGGYRRRRKRNNGITSSSSSFFVSVLLLFFVMVACLTMLTTALPPGFRDEGVADKSGTTCFTFIPHEDKENDYILLLGQKKGYIHAILDPDTHGIKNNKNRVYEVLDISDKTCSDGERGVSSIIIHPNFQQNHYVYLFYTWDKYGGCKYSVKDGPVNVVTRYTVSYDQKGRPLFQQATRIFETSSLPSKVHNGGDMAFGQDGYLYITLGNGGMAYEYGNSQLSNIVLGSLIRITEEGKVPPDNPYVNADGGVPCNTPQRNGQTSKKNGHCTEIYALGLRNPWRFAMNPNTNKDVTQLYINDVGGATWEEVNAMTIPVHNNKITENTILNYGYRDREGPCIRGSITDCQPTKKEGFTDPLHWYQHNDDGDGCITGSTFIPLQQNDPTTHVELQWPKKYTKHTDTYLFADYVFKKIYILQQYDADLYCREDCPGNQPPTSGYTMKEFHATGDLGAPLQLSFGPYQKTLALYYVTWQGDDEYSIRRIVYAGGGKDDTSGDEEKNDEKKDEEVKQSPVVLVVKSPTKKPTVEPTTPVPTKEPTSEPMIPTPRPVEAVVVVASSPTNQPWWAVKTTLKPSSESFTKNPIPEPTVAAKTGADEDDADDNTEEQQQLQHQQFPPLIVYEDSDRPTLLQNCEGDCDSDEDCAENLICFDVNTSEGTSIPDCAGIAPSRTDYCVVDPSLSLPSLSAVSSSSLVGNEELVIGTIDDDSDSDEDEDDDDTEMRNNMAPDAEIFTKKFVYDINELIIFDASNSSDPDHHGNNNNNNNNMIRPFSSSSSDGMVSTSKVLQMEGTPDANLRYDWDFGKGMTSSKPIQKVQYATPGKYRVRLTVTDSIGFFDTTSVEIMVGRPPIPTIIDPVNGTTFAVGDSFTLVGSAVDADGKVLDPALDLSWEVRQMHNTHYHPFLDPETIGNNITISPAPAPEDFDASTNSFLQILLTATDPTTGLTSTVTRDIYPKIKIIRFQTNPPGLLLNLDAFEIQTPSNNAESLEVVSWINHSVSLYVEDQDDMIFETWNNGIRSRKSKYLVEEEEDDAAVLIATFRNRADMFVSSAAATTSNTVKESVPPSNGPTSKPVVPPSVSPTTIAPTMNPSAGPTMQPTQNPTNAPTNAPTGAPTDVPTNAPTENPTNVPTNVPTNAPTDAPSNAPTTAPTGAPTDVPTNVPTENPTNVPTDIPTNAPTERPTYEPSTAEPTNSPTSAPALSVYNMLLSLATVEENKKRQADNSNNDSKRRNLRQSPSLSNET